MKGSNPSRPPVVAASPASRRGRAECSNPCGSRQTVESGATDTTLHEQQLERKRSARLPSTGPSRAAPPAVRGAACPAIRRLAAVAEGDEARERLPLQQLQCRPPPSGAVRHPHPQPEGLRRRHLYGQPLPGLRSIPTGLRSIPMGLRSTPTGLRSTGRRAPTVRRCVSEVIRISSYQ
eukprot:1194490-Prorocentrum_minimum.AAC.4